MRDVVVRERVQQVDAREPVAVAVDTPPPSRIGGMRGMLVPSVKVARTVTNWPSTP
jgi:hypothetical protein